MFIKGDINCLKISCGAYTVSLSKQSSWYEVLIDNATHTMSWGDCLHMTGVVYKIVHPDMEWGRDSSWAVNDYIELANILKVVEGIDDTMKKHYNEAKLLERRANNE